MLFRSGKLIWAKDLGTEYGIKLESYGYSASPLPYKKTIILPIGGEGKGLMAFSMKDGSAVWKNQDFAVTFSTPILIDVNGEDLALGRSAGEREAEKDRTHEVHGRPLVRRGDVHVLGVTVILMDHQVPSLGVQPDHRAQGFQFGHCVQQREEPEVLFVGLLHAGPGLRRWRGGGRWHGPDKLYRLRKAIATPGLARQGG